MKFLVKLEEMGVRHEDSGVIVRFMRDKESGGFQGKITTPEKVPPSWWNKKFGRLTVVEHFLLYATEAFRKAWMKRAKEDPRKR